MDLYFILTVLLIKFAVSQEVIVKLKQGLIKGFEKQVLDQKLAVFLGIPYAQPPIGDRRFSPPQPVEYRDRIEAKSWPNPCQQIYIPDEIFLNLAHRNYNEDCLYLNIWAPKSKTRKPVLVWIHGGGLIVGSSNDLTYEGDVLAATANVVVVSFNYRLNVFGFLFTDTDDAPGNVGLLDQTFAIKWVHENIGKFYGDPKRITIMGYSGGAWSATGHFLSPTSREYYNNVVVFSGSIIADQPYTTREDAKKKSLDVAKEVGCAKNSDKYFNEKIINCLRKVTVEELYQTKASRLVVLVSGDEFFPMAPIEMIRSGNFKKGSQLLFGTLENESSGSAFNKTSQIFKPKFTKRKALNEIETNSNLASLNAISTELFDFYVQTIPDCHSDAIKKSVSILIGDVLTACPTIEFGRLIYEHDPTTRVYHYYYTQDYDRRVAEELRLSLKSVWQPFKGATHGMDQISVFGWPLKEPSFFTKRQKQLSKLMIKTLAKFARFGHPASIDGVDWPAYYYTVEGETAMPYYEFASRDRPEGNFRWNLKQLQCQTLLK